MIQLLFLQFRRLRSYWGVDEPRSPTLWEQRGSPSPNDRGRSTVGCRVLGPVRPARIELACDRLPFHRRMKPRGYGRVGSTVGGFHPSTPPLEDGVP